MFSKIKAAIKDYSETFTALSEVWAKNRKQIDADFANKLRETKLLEAKNDYDQAVADAFKEAKAVIQAEFAAIREKVEAVLAVPPDAALMQLVEAAQLTGKKLSLVEAENYLKKVYVNYPAAVAMCAIFSNAGIKNRSGNPFEVVRYERIADDLQQLEVYAEQAIREPNGYMARNLSSDSAGNPLDSFEKDYLKPFIERK